MMYKNLHSTIINLLYLNKRLKNYTYDDHYIRPNLKLKHCIQCLGFLCRLTVEHTAFCPFRCMLAGSIPVAGFAPFGASYYCLKRTPEKGLVKNDDR